MQPALIILVFIGIVLVFRLLAGRMDRGRIKHYIASKGGRVLDKRWSPLGKGWFGEKDSRIYEVRYEDGDGKVHEATCKTSLLSGVCYTEDTIVGADQSSRANETSETLVEENRRLRPELAKLRRERRLHVSGEFP